MKLSAFIELSAEQKRFAVLKEGVPIAKWDDLHHMVFLFQLPQFYVETYCSKESKIIDEFRVFPSPDHLGPYLQAIPINNLLD
ncbi:hypothetical protein [Pinibacter soli]|uniref:Uncharacterized protein n=1 Tax=Pinibacter soli TaxID=3044211 RepID=A0ABT6RG47_9BACT|nr:hypothetical protein [Pinibacter soli]MDI3321436.1 hypothetical protein [Pinibacter soli]